MTKIGTLINKTLIDGKVNKAEVDALIKLANANGIVSKAEKKELGALLTQTDKFEADAHATLAAFLGVNVPMPDAGKTGGTSEIKPPVPKTPVDLPDPAILEKHNGQVRYGKIEGGKLFVDGVNYDDVKQGAIGNCYFVAGLSAVAYADPKVIEDAIKDNGDGTYTVRFYKTDAYGKATAEYVTVDGDLPGGASPKYAKARQPKELWVPLMEKAFAQWKGSYDAIGGGGASSAAMTALTGKRAGFYATSEPRKDVIFAQIKRAVDSQSAATASTHGKDSGFDYTGTGVYANHAYSIVGTSTEGSTKYVHLRNPWGSSEPGKDGKDDGIFKLKLDDFVKLYRGFSIN